AAARCWSSIPSSANCLNSCSATAIAWYRAKNWNGTSGEKYRPTPTYCALTSTACATPSTNTTNRSCSIPCTVPGTACMTPAKPWRTTLRARIILALVLIVTVMSTLLAYGVLEIKNRLEAIVLGDTVRTQLVDLQQ